jgi:hypothetical protein
MNSPRFFHTIARRLFPLLAVACLAIVFLVSAAGVAGAQNQVSGTFTVKSAVTKFAYAYTFWKPNVFTGKPDLFVLLSDVAIPPDTIPKDDDGIGRIAGMVRDNKVHALELHLAPGYKQFDSAEEVAVYHVGLSPARHGMNGISTFQAKTVTDTTLEGAARTNGPQTSDGVTWQYEVQFKVALPPQGKGK